MPSNLIIFYTFFCLPFLTLLYPTRPDLFHLNVTSSTQSNSIQLNPFLLYSIISYSFFSKSLDFLNICYPIFLWSSYPFVCIDFSIYSSPFVFLAAIQRTKNLWRRSGQENLWLQISGTYDLNYVRTTYFFHNKLLRNNQKKHSFNGIKKLWACIPKMIKIFINIWYK